ncbi:MAG: hypothetical protein ACTS73_03055 [Arsenophonus sp. NEOnobi-MAG3]
MLNACLALSIGVILLFVKRLFDTRNHTQTTISNIEIKVLNVMDRSGNGICFKSALLPPYLNRAKSDEELLPFSSNRRGRIHWLFS